MSKADIQRNKKLLAAKECHKQWGFEPKTWPGLKTKTNRFSI